MVVIFTGGFDFKLEKNTEKNDKSNLEPVRNK